MFVQPGVGNASHTHELEEVFFILQGHLIVFFEEEDGRRIEVVLGPWNCVFLSARDYQQVTAGKAQPRSSWVLPIRSFSPTGTAICEADDQSVPWRWRRSCRTTVWIACHSKVVARTPTGLPTGAADQIAGPSLDRTERGGIIAHAGLRDRALITLMAYSFARIGASVAM